MIRHRPSLQAALCVAIAALAGAAHAQTSSAVSAQGELASQPGIARPPLNLSRLQASTSWSAIESAPDDAQGTNRTEIDHRFGGDKLVGSLGYLCGIDKFQPAANGAAGPASSYGRSGTFLGAKLSYAFH
jgi:hypothetical protein